MLMESFLILSLVVLGGMGNIAGPILGATIWIGLQEWLRDFTFVQAHPEMRGIAMGLVLVLLMIFRPQGLLGSLRVKLEMKPQSKTEADQRTAGVVRCRQLTVRPPQRSRRLQPAGSRSASSRRPSS